MIKDKIKTLKALKTIVKTAQKRGQRIVFTNGCFDILHLGHIRYLEKAKRLGDTLVVAVNSDTSVRKIKDQGRPIFGEKARASLVAALASVDYVTIFSESTPLRLIKALRPDVLVKGGDWQKENIVGKELVQSYGGKIVCIDFIQGYSTSKIIAKIRKQ